MSKIGAVFYFAVGVLVLAGVLIFWLWRAHASDEDEQRHKRPWR